MYLIYTSGDIGFISTSAWQTVHLQVRDSDKGKVKWGHCQVKLTGRLGIRYCNLMLWTTNIGFSLF